MSPLREIPHEKYRWAEEAVTIVFSPRLLPSVIIASGDVRQIPGSPLVGQTMFDGGFLCDDHSLFFGLPTPNAYTCILWLFRNKSVTEDYIISAKSPFNS